MPTDATQERFLEQIEPQVNFRIARFCLQNYSEKETENIDDFLVRCRLQAQKCKFRNEREMEERIIDQIIAGTKFRELQKQPSQQERGNVHVRSTEHV